MATLRAGLRCFEDDLDSGHVRLLQEMIAAGWSNPAIGADVRDMLRGWLQLLTDAAREAQTTQGRWGRSLLKRSLRLSDKRSLAGKPCCCWASTGGNGQSAPHCVGSLQ